MDKQKKIKDQQKQQSNKAGTAKADSEPFDDEHIIPGKYFNDSIMNFGRY